jgi:DeoR family transcriptional regulator of aga operon
MAAALVQPGESVILDVGTTTTSIAHALIAREDLRDVTVFTNGLNIALDLEPYVPRFTVVVMGGAVRPMGHSLVDPLGEMLVERINADTLFLACNGVDLDRGVTNSNLAEASTKRRLLHAARRRVLVADSAKIGVVALAYICDVEAIDLLITDSEVNAHALTALRDRHVEIRLAR